MSLELSFARPTNAAWYPSSDFSRELLALMNSSNAPSIHVKLRGPGRGPFRQPLAQTIKRSVVELLGNTEVRVARLDVADDSGRHPIDLIADRISSKIDVLMFGRYPAPESVLQGLMTAKDEHNDALEEIFGVRNGTMD